MAMNAFQRVQSDPLAFCRQIQCLTAAHTGDTAGICQFGDHRDTISIGDFRHRRVADNGKRQRLQRVSRQDCVGFAKFNMASRQAATQIVIVHCWQVVMDQRIGMNAFDRRSWRIQRCRTDAKHLTGGVNQKWPQAFTA